MASDSQHLLHSAVFSALRLALAALAILLIPVTVSAGQPIQLSLPLDCTPGIDCWVVNRVDLDSSGGVSDFMCQQHTYDGHKGTDFAIRDLRRMGEGVAVLSAAAGAVIGVRDGMPDINVALIGRDALGNRECGNGVVIRHPDGWETQYCHMRQGSVVVKEGDVVSRGDRLGMVGESGWAEFPHVHLSVRHDGMVIDPFSATPPAAGGGLCGDTGKVGATVSGLWVDDIYSDALRGQTAIYNVGFSGVEPTVEAVRAGLFDDAVIPVSSPVLVFWADIFWVEKGDRISLRLFSPDGTILVEHLVVPEKDQARRWVFAGKKRPPVTWPSGRYVGEVVVLRSQDNVEAQTYRQRQEIVVP